MTVKGGLERGPLGEVIGAFYISCLGERCESETSVALCEKELYFFALDHDWHGWRRVNLF